MRRVLIITLVLLSFVGSCGPPISYSEYRGGDVLQGTGGTVETVHGMDVWANGTPDRNYRIVGVIDYECIADGLDHGDPRILSFGGSSLISLKDWRTDVVATRRWRPAVTPSYWSNENDMPVVSLTRGT